MELSFAAAVVALTIIANLSGEVMAEVYGQYIAASYEDWLWTGSVAPIAPEPEIDAQLESPLAQFPELANVK